MEPEKFINKTKEIKLSENEKADIKRSLLNFISENPIRGTEGHVIRPAATRPNFWSGIFLTKLNFASAMAILLVLTLLTGGGLAIGAEKAMPGDILYPVKVGLNEEVRGWLAVSEESKADWEVKRVERRLEEVEKLADEGELDVEVREKIEANFDAHAEKVKNRIEKFENKENFKAAVDVSSKFETSLKAHQKILNRLNVENKGKAKKEVGPLEIKVRSEADNISNFRKRIESKSEVKGSIQINDNDDEQEVEDEANSESKAEVKGQVRVELDL